MSTLLSLWDEFTITVADGAVWLAIGQGLVFGVVCLVFGIWVARTVGLLGSDAPAGETLGVGLASGLMVLAAWWAAIWSGGRSSFTPVAVGFAIAVALTVARRVRRRDVRDDPGSEAAGQSESEITRPRPSRSLILAAVAGGVFVVVVALLYGSTMAPSPRDGVQPVENRDEAYYAVLGRDLATTGTETNVLPSGFADLPGAPTQIWYHWAELWLASAAITILGVAPLAARFFIVLPIVLLAAAALTGTLVNRLARTGSPRAYLFGFFACLFLAPVPLIPGPFFSSWAVGMIFGITLYGLGAVAGLLGLYSVVVLSERPKTWALAGFVGSALAFILPAHIAIAALAVAGVGGICAIRIIRSAMARRRLLVVSSIWVQTIAVTGLVIVATVAWQMVMSRAVGSSSSGTQLPVASAPISAVVSPFNASWRDSVVITVLGGGAFFGIPIAWFLRRREAPLEASFYLGTLGLLVFGAIAWGARLGDFTMFYLYFAGIAVFATPVAIVAVTILWERLRATRHKGMAVGVVVLCLLQLELGVVSGIVRLQGFGPSGNEPIPVALLGAIELLPADAKLAYSCGPFDEVAVGTPQLLSIDAHTGRRVVPMCFEAEFPNTLIGAEQSVKVMSQFFRGAPQSALYPDAAANPSAADVVAFLKRYGIGYIYADAKHPNSLVDNAVSIALSGDAEVLRVP